MAPPLPIPPALLTLLAATPILAVLALMVAAHRDAARAGLAGWLVAAVVAWLGFGAGRQLLVVSQGKAVFASLSVLYIIWAALALAQVVSEAGALGIVGDAVARLTADRTMQLLMLAWAFASFIQGVTGFGVPAAVVAPLLVSLGFPALSSVVATSLGHAWAVTFGSLGSSMVAMIGVTGLPVTALAPATAGLLGVVCLLCGGIVAFTCGGRRAIRHAWPAIAVIGVAMATVQYVVASTRLWNLAAFVAGGAGLATATIMTRMGRYRVASGDDNVGRADAAVSAALGPGRRHSQLSLPWALSGYAALLAVVLCAELVAPIGARLDTVALAVAFPATASSLGWTNPAEAATAHRISVFGHAGALILYSAIIAFAIYAWQGCFAAGAVGRTVRGTVRAASRISVSILLLVGMAMLMQDSGMTQRLAEALSAAVGPLYPAAAPFIGALGAFMTGTNTHSNVVFASLQLEAARALGVPAGYVLGAQNVGGAVGSVFAPAKVVVACAAVGMAAREHEVVRRNLTYGVAILALVGLLGLALVTVTGAG